MKISLIVLTYNEIEGFKSIMPSVDKNWIDEILVVDGGSTDGTIKEAERQGYKVIVQQNPGRGEAFRVGLNNSLGDIIIYFSPDGNEKPEDIPKLIAKQKDGYDQVIASRFSPASISYDATLVRRIGNNAFTFIINKLFKTKVDDAVNGFRLITRKCMLDLNTKAKYFEIEIEMTIKAAKKGYNTGEISTIEPKRIGGVAKLNTVVDGLRYLKLIFREYFNS